MWKDDSTYSRSARPDVTAANNLSNAPLEQLRSRFTAGARRREGLRTAFPSRRILNGLLEPGLLCQDEAFHQNLRGFTRLIDENSPAASGCLFR